MNGEPWIEINGESLTVGQAMAVRVAVNQFLMDVTEPEFAKKLGPIALGYAARLREVNALMGVE